MVAVLKEDLEPRPLSNSSPHPRPRPRPRPTRGPKATPHPSPSPSPYPTLTPQVLKEDVKAGEELCNSYIDIELPYAERQRELAEYGFACMCARCVAEQPAAAAPRAPRKLK